MSTTTNVAEERKTRLSPLRGGPITSKNSPLARLRSLVPRSPSHSPRPSRSPERSVMSVNISLAGCKDHPHCKYAALGRNFVFTPTRPTAARRPSTSVRKHESPFVSGARKECRHPFTEPKMSPTKPIQRFRLVPKARSTHAGIKARIAAMFARNEREMAGRQAALAKTVDEQDSRLRRVGQRMATVKAIFLAAVAGSKTPQTQRTKGEGSV